MGSGASHVTHLSVADKKSRMIDKELRQESIRIPLQVKLLLLGTSESGKSTLAKQMRIIYHDGFNGEDRLVYKHLIHCNVVSFAVAIIKAMRKQGIKFAGGTRTEESASFVLANALFVDHQDIEVMCDLASSIKKVWTDDMVQKQLRSGIFNEGLELANYFIKDIDRISAKGYLPSDYDILRSRHKTTGVVKTKFQYKNYEISLLDVGGQRTERRKWIHLFDNVTSVLFTVPMGHYDLISSETDMNRLRESLKVFCWVNEQEALKNCSIIIFLNQKDILMEKLPSSTFSKYFPGFDGKETYESVSCYIRDRFETIPRLAGRELYSHFTSAIDTQDTEFVMQAAMSTILNSHLREVAMW